jgi:hypothetical protein
MIFGNVAGFRIEPGNNGWRPRVAGRFSFDPIRDDRYFGSRDVGPE